MGPHEGGNLPGGSLAYVRVRWACDGLHAGNDNQNAGIKIVARALEEPLLQIATEARRPSVVLATVS